MRLGTSSKVSALTTHSLVLDISMNKLFLALGSWLLALGSWLLALGSWLLVSKLKKLVLHFNHALVRAMCKVLYVKTAIQMSAFVCEVP